MFEQKNLKKHLAKALCAKCGNSLDTATLVPVTKLPLATVAHAVCHSCKSENMITITSVGAGVMPMISDLTSGEIKKFAKSKNITSADIIAVHEFLKKESICNLMLKKEHSLEKKQKN